MNMVHGLDAGAPKQVDDVTAFYRGLGLRGWTEVAPEPGADAVMERMTSAGWAQTGFWCSFDGAPRALPMPDGVDVAEATAGDMPEFARVHLDGHEVPSDDRAAAQARSAGTAGRGGTCTWRGSTGLRPHPRRSRSIPGGYRPTR